VTKTGTRLEEAPQTISSNKRIWDGASGRLPKLLFRRRQSRLEQRLAELSAATAKIRLRTEPEFLQLSSDLHGLHAAAMELSRATREQVTAVREVLGGTRLTGAGGLADCLLADLQSGLTEAESRARVLERSCEAMGRLRGYGKQIERIASLLNVSGYGFAVESARSEASQTAFDSFVTQLRTLAGRVRTLGETITDQAELARAESEQLGRATGKSLVGLRELTSRAEIAARQTSERVEQLLDRSWAVLQEAERHTARIASHAGDAVYHLQFGDIVRQKLEHIEAALGATQPAGMAQVLSVQAGQLDLVAEEVASARRQLEQAFTGLAEETRLLVAATSQFGQFNRQERGRKSGSDPMAELRAAFLDIGGLRGQGQQLCVKAGETSARAMETATSLFRYLAEVEEINEQMHLQALNAIVKTALLGDDGRTLEILSMHVHGVFVESTGLVKETVDVIESISSSASACAAPLNEDTNSNAALEDRIGRLESLRTEFSRAMDSATAEAGRQGSRLEQARGRLAFLSEMENQVAAVRKDIGEAIGDLATAGGRIETASSDALGVRYTIASEREVHRRVIGGADRPPASDAETAAASGDNIDLFEDSPAPAAPAAGEDEMGDNVELF